MSVSRSNFILCIFLHILFHRREACQALRATGNKVPAAVRFAENEAVKARELNEV